MLGMLCLSGSELQSHILTQCQYHLGYIYTLRRPTCLELKPASRSCNQLDNCAFHVSQNFNVIATFIIVMQGLYV